MLRNNTKVKPGKGAEEWGLEGRLLVAVVIRLGLVEMTSEQRLEGDEGVIYETIRRKSV